MPFVTALPLRFACSPHLAYTSGGTANALVLRLLFLLERIPTSLAPNEDPGHLQQERYVASECQSMECEEEQCRTLTHRTPPTVIDWGS